MGLVEELKVVLEKVDVALLFKDAPEEIFLEYVDAYLILLEDWQKVNKDALADPNVKNLPGFSDCVEDLRTKHQLLMDDTIKSRDELGLELSGINVRAKAIRKYIDVLPERVSLTRGKKG